MDFLGIGSGEILLILVIILLVIGPQKLLQIGRTIGEITRKMKDTTSQFARQMNEEMEDTKAIKTEITDVIQSAVQPKDEKSEQKNNGQTETVNHSGTP